MDESIPRAPTNMQSVLDRLLDEAEGGGNGDIPPPPPASPHAETTAIPTAAPASASASPVSPLLGSLLSNPALLSALPTLLENLSPLMAGSGKTTGGGISTVNKHHADRHTALLCAIKPYLSAERQEAAETVIRLCRVWDALERSGISLSGVLSSLGGAVPASAPAPEAEREVT